MTNTRENAVLIYNAHSMERLQNQSNTSICQMGREN